VRLAAPVADGYLAGLVDAPTLVFWDSDQRRTEEMPNPAGTLAAGRRLAAVSALIAHDAEVVCAVPHGFCTASHAVARAAGFRFLPFETGTPLKLVQDHAAALVMVAQSAMPADWLDLPATVDGPRRRPAGELHLSEATQQALRNRLRRLEGQARGVQRLLDERQSCEEILTQLAAMRSALQAVTVALLTENLAGCLAATADDGDQQRMVEAAKRAFRALN